jgi:hypothetical protein
LSYTCSSFFSGYFGDGISETICSGWPQTAILLNLASQVARIIDMSHQNLTVFMFLKELGMVVYACNVSYSEGRARRFKVGGQ